MTRPLALWAVPVDPDAPTARRWAAEELTNPVYHRGPSLLSRLVDWLKEHLDGIWQAGQSTGTGALVVVAILLVLVVVAVVVAGPVRRSHRLHVAGPGAVLDDARSAARLRADASTAAARADWDSAVADWFRAVVRGLEERTVLQERPGRTADEAARSAGQRLTALAGELDAGAALFDDVVYGGRRADQRDEARMRALESSVRAARPEDVPAVIG